PFESHRFGAPESEGGVDGSADQVADGIEPDGDELHRGGIGTGFLENERLIASSDGTPVTPIVPPSNCDGSVIPIASVEMSAPSGTCSKARNISTGSPSAARPATSPTGAMPTVVWPARTSRSVSAEALGGCTSTWRLASSEYPV